MFKQTTHEYGNDKTQVSLKFKITLSYKNDMRCYYKIHMSKDILSFPAAVKSSIMLIDKNKMILHEFTPGWSVNDFVTNIENGIIRRGSFNLDKGLFKDIDSYEIYFKSTY